MKCLYALLAIAPMAAGAASLEFGVGKLANNTNSRLPGVMASARGSLPMAYGLGLTAGYTRVGKSQLAEDAAFTTAGIQYSYKRFTFEASSIVRASYNPTVWWDPKRPGHQAMVEEVGCQRYPNDGKHLNKSSTRAGSVVAVEYRIGHGVGLRAEYYGVTGISPTLQGFAFQVTYTLSSVH